MIKTVVISGNEYPATAPLVQAALEADKNVMVAVADDEGEVQTPGNGARAYGWHKASPISARSMLLDAENAFETIDCGFIVFDTDVFLSKFNAISLENISRGNDEMVVAMEYLTYEFIKRFEVSKKGTLCFVLVPGLTLADTMQNSRVPHDIVPLSAINAGTQAFFRAFAENIAAASINKSYKVVLVEKGNESREVLSKWLIPFIDEYSDLKKKIPSKELVKWLHVGAKVPSSRSFFSR